MDATSAQSALAPYSTGARDDLIQRRTLEAYLTRGGESDDNPVSSITGRPMSEEMMLWACDSRPHPSFPARVDVWADGASWRLPAHVRARRDAAGHVAMRCARRGGDSWAGGEPPLGEVEGCRLDILEGSGAVVRSAETLSSPLIYAAAQQTADFGAAPASLRLRIAQLAASGAPGLNTELTIPL